MRGGGNDESLSQSAEDYIKVIYNLNQVVGRATTNEIAEQMDVSPASVTNMLKKLAEARPPLIEYQKHQGAVLTPAGEKAALEVLRHHRLLEMFLQQVLGYEWDEVHAEADRLEHVISPQFAERIASVMGDPRQDPHGDPIPSQDLSMPDRETTPLSDLRPRQTATIQRVSDQEPGLLRYLRGNGLIPGARLTILDYTPYDETLHIKVEGQKEPLVIGPGITRKVFVFV